MKRIKVISIFILGLLMMLVGFNYLKNLYANKLDIDKIEKFSVYKVDFQSGVNLNEEELSKNVDYVVKKPGNYFKSITYKKNMVLWKGDKLGIMIYDKSIIKIRVSWYGNFFSIEGREGYYSYKLIKK